MYEIFDSFCRRPTWDTSHLSDMKVFKEALRAAVKLPEFSPEEMGEYIRRNHATPIWPKTDADLNRVIDGLVKDARAALRRRAA